MKKDAAFGRHPLPNPLSRRLGRSASLALLALLGASSCGAAGHPAPPRLRSETAAAFKQYVQLTDARNEEELRKGAPFFWVDTLPELARAEAYAELRRGEVKMQRLETRDAGRLISCPNGLIHHWVGLVFLPGARLDDVLAVLQDYDHHSAYYAPEVERSRTESRDGDHFRVFLRFHRRKVITVVLNTEHDVRYFRASPSRAHSRSSAIRVAQVENAGGPHEREKPAADDDGFLWKMETWWRMEERDGGVYVQSEAASLTRDIPAVLGWLVGPFVTSIPRESLTFTLEATRRAVRSGQRNTAGHRDDR